jgi:hypothetical protein
VGVVDVSEADACLGVALLVVLVGAPVTACGTEVGSSGVVVGGVVMEVGGPVVPGLVAVA